MAKRYEELVIENIPFVQLYNSGLVDELKSSLAIHRPLLVQAFAAQVAAINATPLKAKAQKIYRTQAEQDIIDALEQQKHVHSQSYSGTPLPTIKATPQEIEQDLAKGVEFILGTQEELTATGMKAFYDEEFLCGVFPLDGAHAKALRAHALEVIQESQNELNRDPRPLVADRMCAWAMLNDVCAIVDRRHNVMEIASEKTGIWLIIAEDKSYGDGVPDFQYRPSLGSQGIARLGPHLQRQNEAQFVIDTLGQYWLDLLYMDAPRASGLN